MLTLALGIGAAVWLFPDKPAAAPVTASAEEAAAIVYDLEIYHYHVPGMPESEEIADSLDKVDKKYGRYVRVNRVDITQNPELAKAEKVTRPPKVVMMAGDVRACKFQGVWTYPQIERKVEEILRGLKRMSKDWRPEVQGMQPATQTP